MWAFIKDFMSGKKLAYAALTFAVETVMGFLRSRFPDVTLPSTDQVLALGMGLIGCHTLTDLTALIKDAVLAYLQTPKPASGVAESIASAFKMALGEANQK
jgi:hypothetical protein